jgi:hypothetical protein
MIKSQIIIHHDSFIDKNQITLREMLSTNSLTHLFKHLLSYWSTSLFLINILLCNRLHHWTLNTLFFSFFYIYHNRFVLASNNAKNRSKKCLSISSTFYRFDTLWDFYNLLWFCQWRILLFNLWFYWSVLVWWLDIIGHRWY